MSLTKRTGQTESASPVGSTSEMVMRPVGATRAAFADCLQWIESCRQLGWDESAMDDLENLWWKYHDKDGKPHNDQTERPEAI